MNIHVYLYLGCFIMSLNKIIMFFFSVPVLHKFCLTYFSSQLHFQTSLLLIIINRAIFIFFIIIYSLNKRICFFLILIPLHLLSFQFLRSSASKTMLKRYSDNRHSLGIFCKVSPLRIIFYRLSFIR